MSNPDTTSTTSLTNEEKQQKLRADIRSFVVTVFQDSQSISLTEKAKFGKLVRHPEARLWFAQFVDEYRVNKEDFQPAKIIMNMMFTYYYHVTTTTSNANSTQPTTTQSTGQQHTNGNSDPSSHQQVYLYQFLKDQQIFKSIRFWTSAFYESVISERNNHQVFKPDPSPKGAIDSVLGSSESSHQTSDDQMTPKLSSNKKVSQDKRIEELKCNRNITFGLLGSFIHNMMLLGLSQSFCQEFLDKHSTIAGLDKEQTDALYGNLSSMFNSISEEQQQNPKAASKPTPLFRKPLSFSIKNPTLHYRPKFL